jgi:hypothetical protein
MPIGLGSPGVSPGTPGLLPSLAPTYDVVFVDQTVVLQVYIDGVLWDQAYQAVVHHSLDRRYASCEIHFTGGERATLDGSPAPPVPALTYWSRVEVRRAAHQIPSSPALRDGWCRSTIIWRT